MTCHLLLPIMLVSLWGAAAPGRAEGRVELELVTEARAPITAQQEWLRRLAQLGVGNLRIGGIGSPEKVGVVVRGTERAPVYKVTGVLTSSGDVLLPGGRFRPGDAARLAQWLDDLARLGPIEGRPQESAFGLSVQQFERVHKEMSQPVAFSTKGMPRHEVVEKIAERLRVPLRVAPGLLPAADDDTIAEELSNLSRGTALAYAVRPLGVCLVPRDSGPGGLECVLTKAKPNMEAWPIGWEPEKRPGDVLPGLFEFLNTNVQNVAATQVLEAVGGRLEVVVLLDYNAMARHGIEPEKALVSLPQSRTSYSLLLKKTLYQAGLKSELRVDESGQPFLWVTTIKPI
ncbi:MAG: hypothetical protein ABIP48_07200 [Planctomycetota bacterium]